MHHARFRRSLEVRCSSRTKLSACRLRRHISTQQPPPTSPPPQTNWTLPQSSTRASCRRAACLSRSLSGPPQHSSGSRQRARAHRATRSSSRSPRRATSSGRLTRRSRRSCRRWLCTGAPGTRTRTRTRTSSARPRVPRALPPLPLLPPHPRRRVSSSSRPRSPQHQSPRARPLRLTVRPRAQWPSRRRGLCPRRGSTRPPPPPPPEQLPSKRSLRRLPLRRCAASSTTRTTSRSQTYHRHNYRTRYSQT